MTPSTAVAKQEVSGALAAFTDLAPQEIELVHRQIAPGASLDELAVFLSVARMWDLNPLAREIWCVKLLDDKGEPKTNRQGMEYPAQIMIGRDGYLTIAERSGVFDGILSGVVKENDEFTFGLLEPEHTFAKDEGGMRGQIVGAYAYVYRTDRRYPARVFAEWTEHGKPKTRYQNDDGSWGAVRKGTSPWLTTPSLMIRKVAEANALKIAFRVSGATAADSPEDADNQIDGDVVDAEVVSETPARPEDEAATPSDSPQPDDAAGSEPGEQGELGVDDDAE